MNRLLLVTFLAFLLLVGCNKKTAVEKPTIINEPPVVTEPQQMPRRPPPPAKPRVPRSEAPLPLPPPRPAPRMHEVCTWVFLPIFQHCEMVIDEQR